MKRLHRMLVSAAFLLGVVGPASAGGDVLTAPLRGNVADQVIAGFASSTATWDLERGQVSVLSSGTGRTLVVVRTNGLIIPALGFNPSPDLLARIVCHDGAGMAFEAARTRAVPFPQSGDATLRDVVSLPPDCFAPIVLLTGSIDPQGESPGKFFAVTGF